MCWTAGSSIALYEALIERRRWVYIVLRTAKCPLIMERPNHGPPEAADFFYSEGDISEPMQVHHIDIGFVQLIAETCPRPRY
jgi:hypothetical protein